MTALSHHPQMLPEEFEELARAAARIGEGIRPEFVDGRLGVKGAADGDHGLIIEWLLRICLQARPTLFLHSQGLRIEPSSSGFAIPDGTLAPADAFVGQGEWADPRPALMVVEVTSYDSTTTERDRVDKPRAYAETAVPIHLLIDRDGGGIALDTEPLQQWVRRRLRTPATGASAPRRSRPGCAS